MPEADSVPNPGSQEAVAAGCTCAVLDNCRGRRAPYPPDGWWITKGCPVHARIDGLETGPCERPSTVIGCRCVWHGVICAKPATQEDLLCDWCGTRRPEDMRNNPFAMWSPDGEYLGLGGGTATGYNHQAGWGDIPDDVRPTACWMEERRVQ